jgi:hypothetical protein
MYERITASDPVGPARYGHDFRYRLASAFIGESTSVVDAACGSGYGCDLLHHVTRSADFIYMGFDLIEPLDLPYWAQWFIVDLEEIGQDFMPHGYDVLLGFETIEHLHNYTAYVRFAKQARRWIIMSAPVVPTVGVNPYHHRDFIPGQLQAILEDRDWEHYQTVQQPSELSEIVVMRRRT